jgi:tRNA (guanine10-N2)-dimethyltransferase
MYNKLTILGRQSALSLAELEALLGDHNVCSHGAHVALVNDAGTPLTHATIGGTIKIGEVIGSYPTQDFRSLLPYITTWLDTYTKDLPEGKLKIGISLYGLKGQPRAIGAFGLEIKRHLKSQGKSVRLVPNTTSDLSSAQVFHNHLANELGVEFLIASDGKETVIARTTSVQDINNYSRRDYHRPRRDAFVGMLPPKLAQIMLNLAQAEKGSTVLDPFCGTGVVLMEATLRGCQVIGSDISQKMIDYTEENLKWLSEVYETPSTIVSLGAADAQSASWATPIDHAVCETYLGRPLSILPRREDLEKIRSECDSLVSHFLTNLLPQLGAQSRCTIAVPAWKKEKGFIHLPVIDQLEKIGYNRHSFSHANYTDMIYSREDQLVARELLVLTKR